MILRTLLSNLAVVSGLLIATQVAAESHSPILVTDAYARASTPNAKAGAAFLILENTSDEADRLISVKSPVAARIELHTHIDAGNGVMQMREVEDGFTVPPGGSRTLKRGGDHIMLMGLREPLLDGVSITATLVFEKAGEMEIRIPVDLQRKAEH